MSNSLWSHELQTFMSRLLCPSPSLRVCSNSCALNQWYHPTISSSVTPSSSCPQSSPASGSFLNSQLIIDPILFKAWKRVGERERGRKEIREGGKEEGRKTFPSLPCNCTGSDQLDISTYRCIGASRNALQWELTYLLVRFFVVLNLFIA